MSAHVPVLQEEVVALFRPQPGGRYLDATVGLGGHAEAILRASAPTGVVLGFDHDAEALALTGQRLAAFGARLVLRQGRYEALTELVGSAERFDGVLFDLGASSLQLDAADRGFSFTQTGPLDMRMDRGTGTTAAELLDRLSERELADLIFEWAEERWSRRIAEAILQVHADYPKGLGEYDVLYLRSAK